MMRQERGKSPESLKQNYKKWGREYREILSFNPKWNGFNWHNCYREIEEALFRQTINHCSFCDIRPLRASGPTVEHFRPKKRFPLLAYFWSNLFYCCGNCQKKGNKFELDCTPLKPDTTKYFFDYYFIARETIEEVFIEPNPERSLEEQKRAEITINLFGLNKFGRPEARKSELEDRREDLRLGKNKDINSYSYRFILPTE